MSPSRATFERQYAMLAPGTCFSREHYSYADLQVQQAWVIWRAAVNYGRATR